MTDANIMHERVEVLAALLRRWIDRLDGFGAEVWAVSYLRALATRPDEELLVEVRALLEALDLVDHGSWGAGPMRDVAKEMLGPDAGGDRP